MSQKGFTLIEAIVGALILILISASSWMAISVLTKSGETSRQESQAVNLLQKSQEEVRRVAQRVFDSLETCVFPGQVGSNTCGFDDITHTFPGFTRALSVTPEQNSTEFKRAHITVYFNDMFQERELHSIVLLARPPHPLPGNIVGVVRPLGSPGDVVEGAAIIATLQNTSETHATTSRSVVSAQGENFDFADLNSGRFILTPGIWEITVDHNDYFPYTHPLEPPLAIESNEEEFVTIELEPRPESATIQANVVNQNNNQLVNSFDGGSLYIYENGQLLNHVDNQRAASVTITFEDANQRCFTINTENAFLAAYAKLPSCSFQYDREGWSSSIYQNNGSLICSNPRNGDANSDRICVGPSDTLTVNVPLLPVPEVNIVGRVITSQGAPISGAKVYAQWPRSDQGAWRKDGQIQSATTNASGQFIFSVPAVQAMFPRNNPTQNHLQVRAEAIISVLSCCDMIQHEQRLSAVVEAGPLFPGDPDRNIGDLVIPVNNSPCGNVTGVLTNGFAGTPLANGQVSIRDDRETANGSGRYTYDCPASGYRLYMGDTHFQAAHTNFYPYHTEGNAWYAPAQKVNIIKDQVVTYNARLWPKGFGDVKIIVKDTRTGLPVLDALVQLQTYSGRNYQGLSSLIGEVDFNAVEETWPAPTLPINDPYYNYTPGMHVLNVSHSSGVYAPVTQTISDLKNGDQLTITINLSTQGGL